MNSAHQVNPPLPGAKPGLASDNAASLGNLATDTSDYVQAWSALFASEARLAGANVLHLAFAALVVPAMALTICTVVDALLATLLQHWLGDWASATALVLCLNLACLFGLLVAMRRWWRSLSLPRSRDALTQLLGRLA